MLAARAAVIVVWYGNLAEQTRQVGRQVLQQSHAERRLGYRRNNFQKPLASLLAVLGKASEA